MKVDAKVATSSITVKIIIAMKTNLIVAVSALVVLSSCSVCRSGQTPDEVYFSPGKTQEQAAYVEANGDRDDGSAHPLGFALLLPSVENCVVSMVNRGFQAVVNLLLAVLLKLLYKSINR